MPNLKEGDTAPEFTALKASGGELKLSDLKGKNVVLYFFPKDDTPGCTIEANEFTRDASKFADADTVVLGVSIDNIACHNDFIKKYSLKVELLEDTDQTIAKLYESAGDKYAQRNTFVINKEGKIKKAFWKVNPEGHSEEVLKAIQE